MSWLQSLYASTIGKKAVMAITGLIIFGFTLGHMAGNLLAFFGEDTFNTYAATLKGNPPLLWGTRLLLLTVIPLHFLTAFQLIKRSNDARPATYSKWQPQRSTYASRTIRFGGIYLLGFILYHLAHYTLHLTNPEFAGYHDAQGRHDAFRMVVEGFSNPVNVAVYLVAMLSLVFHLSHGAWSMFQSMGLNHPKYNQLRERAAWTLAIVLTVGFSSVPIAVLTGVVHR